MSCLERDLYLLRGGVDEGTEFVEVRAGNELSRFPAAEQQTPKVRTAFQLLDDFGQLRQHGLRERVDLFLGNVKAQQRDRVFQLFQLKHAAHLALRVRA